MSRSYRRPFMAVTGAASAKSDKRIAHRGVRRKQNLALQTCLDYDGLLIPHPLECTWNDNWSWDRDGGQLYHSRWYESGDEAARRSYLRLLRK